MLVKKNFLTHLEALLVEHHGIKEYDLVKLLQGQKIPYFSDIDLGDDLQLYQAHFMLFHHLYQLRDQLREEKRADLQIHCMGICLLPYPRPAIEPEAEADPLRDYYLDFDAAKKVSEVEVKGMLEGFWKDFQNYENSQKSQLGQGCEVKKIKGNQP